MKQKFLVMLMMLGISINAQAQLGGLGGMLGLIGGGGGGGVDSNAVERFTVDAFLINKSVTYAALQIQAALGDKQKIAALKESIDKMNSSTDPQEQNALMGTIQKSQLAGAIDLLKSTDGKARMEQLSPEMKEKVAKSLFAVGVSALRIKPLMDNGSKMPQAMASNPMLLPKLVLVKESLVLLADAAPKLPDLVSTGFALMKDVKVNPGNPTAESKLEVDTNIMIPD
jgi:hypothetical protein